MTKAMVECAGMYDFVKQVKEVIKSENVIDVSTIGGTGGNVFYYFDSVDSEGNIESHQVYGKTELLEKLIKVFEEGGDVDMATLGASGGRQQWIWFEAEGEVEEDKETPTEDSDEPEDTTPEEDIIPDKVEEEKPVEVKASAAAIELAKLNNVDLSKVTGTLAGGKISKPDVVKYMGNN